MKKLTLSILSIALSALLLSACNSSEEGDKRPENDRRPANRPAFTNLEQARTLVTSQERGLERKHGYHFVYRNGGFSHIIPPSFDPIDWVLRYEFYEDGLTFASNLILLRQNERAFIRENEGLYRDLVRKTKAMAVLIFNPTYTFAVSSLEELEGFQYDVAPVKFLEFLGLELNVYSYSPNGATHVALEWSRSAREMCEQISILNQFDLNDLNISHPGTVRSCARYPKARMLSALQVDEPVERTVQRVNQNLLNYYDSVANQMMNSSGIFLSADFNEGYDFIRRTEYEQAVLAQNGHYPISLVSIALTNNLYENLYFKISVLRAKEHLFGSNPQTALELDLALRAFSGLIHNSINIRLGESPFNAGSTIGSEDLSNIPNVEVRPTQGEVRRAIPQAEERAPVQLEQRPQATAVERTEPTPIPEVREEAPEIERRPLPEIVREEPAQTPDPQPAPAPAPVEAEVEADAGNSSAAPLNDGPAPIVVPEEVEDFFAD